MATSSTVRAVTLSTPKSVSLMALVGGDDRIVDAHDRAVGRTLAWIEKNAVETRMQDPETGAMVRAENQKMIAATFRHDTSRNLDPQLHTHAVIANMVQGEDQKWRTMVDDGLFKGTMTIGAIYRAELARGLQELGYEIEKTHPDGRFEIAGGFAGGGGGVFDAPVGDRGGDERAWPGQDGDNPHLAARANLMTRAAKRDVERGELRRSWERQAAELGFSAETVRAKARQAERKTPGARPVHGSGTARGGGCYLGGGAPFRTPGGVRPWGSSGSGNGAGVRGYRADACGPELVGTAGSCSA